MNSTKDTLTPKSEYKNSKSPTKPLKELKDGTYEGIYYGHTFELPNGEKYKTDTGIKTSRGMAPPKKYLKRGKFLIPNTTFSGYSDNGTLRAAVGTAVPVKDDPSIDKVFHKPKQKKFSFGMNSGEFTGDVGKPRVNVKVDPSIMKDDKGGSMLKPSIQTSPVALDWEKDGTFKLELEPWLTSPVISDTDDGFYIGHLTGGRITTESKSEINLAITVNTLKDHDLPVIVLVKRKKAYIFKKSQMIVNSGSRLFSSTKGDIDTPEEFREYAHKVMKKAHKDNYSKDTTDKVVDDLLKDHSGKDYGELIGRLTSGLGNKSYSDQPENQQQPSTPPQQSQSAQPSQDQGQSQEGSENPDAQGAPETKGGNPAVSNTSEVDYSFEYQLSEPKDVGSVVGTIVMSASIAHLYHLCTTSYAVHRALGEYYEEIPELVDRLAEYYLSTTLQAKFTICVVPNSMDPAEYFTSLSGFLNSYIKDSTNDEVTRDLTKEILIKVNTTLYKISRLTLGKKVFSVTTSDKTFSMGPIIPKTEEKAHTNRIVSTIKEFVSQNRKSPLKDLKRTDDIGIVRFVEDRKSPSARQLLTDELLESILKDGMKKAKKSVIK